MMGEDREAAPLLRVAQARSDVVLAMKDVSTINEKGSHTLRNVSLTLRAGRILGLAGVDGNGQSEIAEVITGLLPPSSGQILVDGEDISAGNAGARRSNGVAISYVPEDRARVGLVLDHTIGENLTLRSYASWPFAKYGMLRFRAILEHAEEKIRTFDIRLRSAGQSARDLSGGNQQKVVLARELEGRPRIIVVAQPTKGLDIGSAEFVQRKLIEARYEGAAILYISTELERLMEISDEIAVLCRGEITGQLRPQEADVDRIGLMMSGERQPELAG